MNSSVGEILQTIPIQIRILGSVALAMVLGAVIGLENFILYSF